MTKDEAVDLVWEYMHMGHELKKADVILVLGVTATTYLSYMSFKLATRIK